MSTNRLSQAEIKQQEKNLLGDLINGVKSLNQKTQGLESGLGIESDKDIMRRLQEIINDIAELSRFRLTGGNIFISETAPENPKTNDIWFDLNLIRRK